MARGPVTFCFPIFQKLQNSETQSLVTEIVHLFTGKPHGPNLQAENDRYNTIMWAPSTQVARGREGTV